MDIKSISRFVLILNFIQVIYGVDLSLIDCEPNDQITRAGSEYTFSTTVSDYTGCRAVVDNTLAITPSSYYTITADLKPGPDSTPGIIFNVAGDQKFDMIIFRTNDYNCVQRATMNGGYTEDTASNTYCSGYRVFDDQWFSVVINVYAKKFSVSINDAFNLELDTDHPQLATYGFLHGYGYEDLCSYNCMFQFRVPEIEPENVLIEKFEQQGVLESLDYGTSKAIDHNILYKYQINLDRVGQPQGTVCFLAFYTKDIDIGTATLTVGDDEVHNKGTLRMYSTTDNSFDVYFATGLIDSTKQGFKLLYQVFSCSATSQDLCFLCDDGHYNNVYDDFKRSTGYTSDPNDYISDSSLAMGWYRFRSCAGGFIPTTDPGKSDICGTKDPIYIQGYTRSDPPTPGLVDGNACVTRGGICLHQWDMPIYVCPDFELYYLVQTPDQSGYCAGDGVTCASQNKVSFGGDACSQCSAGAYPELTDVPTLGEWTYEGAGIYNLPCNIPGPTDPAMAEVKVEWIVEYVDRRVVIQSKPHITTNAVFLPSNAVTKDNLQNHIICRVRSNFQGTTVYGPWFESAPMFIGIKAVETFQEIGSDETLPFYFEFTMPITCDGANCLDPDDTNCVVDVHFVTETKHLTRHGCANLIYKEPELLHFRACSMTVSCNAWNSGGHKQILKVKNTMMKGVPSYTHTLYMVVRDKRGMWESIVSQAQIHVNMDGNENHLTSRCTVWNDPHITTFEGRFYDTHLEGEFLIHRSVPKEDKNMELVVTDNIKYCRGSGGPACNTAFGVRLKDEAIVLNRETRPKHNYIAAVAAEKEPGFILTQTNSYRNYQIYLPRGEVLLFTYNHNYLYMTIDSPREKQQRNPEHGLCGKVNPLGTPYLLYRNGTEYKKSFTDWADLHDFTPSWRVTDDEALVYKKILKASTPSTTKSYYTCSVHDVNDFILGFHTAPFERVLDRERCAPYSQKNLLEQTPRGLVLGRKKRNYRTNTLKTKLHTKRSTNNKTWTDERALAYCHSYIVESPIGGACQTIVTDIDAIVQQCARDIIMTNSTDWAAGTLTSLREMCVFAIYQDLTLWTPEVDATTNTSVLHPPLYLLNNMCPNGCSNHGQCVGGLCECSDGYIDYDCSLPVDNPPTLHGIVDRAVCHGTDDCHQVVILGEDFVNVDLLSCHFWTDTETSDGSALANTQATMMDTDLVACPYPEIQNPISTHSLLRVAVSNDGEHHSDTITTVITHVPCLMCNHTEDSSVSCYVQDGMCLIEEKCVPQSNDSSHNSCMYCDPQVDQYFWSETTGCKSKLLPIWAYVTIGLVSVAIIVTIVVVAAVLSKKVPPQKTAHRKGNTYVET